MKLVKMIALICVLMMGCASVASACTSIYVGSDLTADGTTIFGRSEDFSIKDYNKLYYVSPAGNHVAGEEYQGCFGFTYTFTHDSYSYTARRDDNLSGVCPDCGGTHAHTPYEEAGANEKGVIISASEFMSGNDAVSALDPHTQNGIEQAEITTILLSEASTAKEALDLLTSIYDEVGTNTGSGIFIADQNETWFIENMTGHTYLAVKLNPSVVFMQPNISTIGKINLNDTENVVASANVISVAQEAGTFVGDADANIIDFSASYSPEAGGSKTARLASGLNYLNGVDTFTAENVTDADHVLTNVGSDGEIIPLTSNIKLSKAFGIDDVVNFYRADAISNVSTAEVSIFQVDANAELDTAIVEWAAMGEGRYTAFIPSYPLLTTETADFYMVSGATTLQETEPTEGDWYKTDDGYMIYPANWKTSNYWVMNVISNLMNYGEFSAEDKASVQDAFLATQQEIYTDFAAMQEAVANAGAFEEKQSAATNGSKQMAEKAFADALEIAETYIAK